MKNRYLSPSAVLALVTLIALALASDATLAQEKPKAPEPGVPELFTLQGQFVRIAYNNEGYVSLGYRVANQSVRGVDAPRDGGHAACRWRIHAKTRTPLNRDP